MTLPLDAPADTPWPPTAYSAQLRDLVDIAAAWTNDERDQFGSESQQDTAKTRGLFGWRRRTDGGQATRARAVVTTPIAGDVAAVSADLLFGDPAILTAPDTADTDAGAYLEDLTERLALPLHSAADMCAGLGGVWLIPRWDADTTTHAVLQAVGQDQAVPEYRMGMLHAVTIVTVLPNADPNDKSNVWRHLERHEAGVVWHSLRRGDTATIGTLRPLEDHPATAPLARLVNAQSAIPLTEFGVPGLMPQWVPNSFWRRYRTPEYGAADHHHVLRHIDALHEAYSSWAREIRLGQARIYMDRGLLGRGGEWDVDQELVTLVEGLGGTDSAGRPIEQVNFTLRVSEHAQTCAELTERIVTACGYAPQTFGLHTEGALSGTAHDMRERRTRRTGDRKRRAWKPAVLRAAQWLAAIDGSVYRIPGAGPVDGLNLEWSSDDQASPRDVAETVKLLRDAKAASVETAVRLAQPDLDDAAVSEEVARINAESGTGGLGMFGTDLPDPGTADTE